MNNYYTYIKAILILISISFSSCEDFLTLNPESQYSVNISYKKPEDFKKAIAGAYGKQKDIYKSHGINIVLNARCDEMKGVGGLYGIGEFTDTAKNSKLDEIWSCIWSVIMQCNYIIDKIDGINFTDSKMKDNIKGEAHALRAWGYNTLACMFGGMPLYNKVISLEEAINIKRSTQEETFAFAEEEYKKAISLLPETWSGEDLGRITKYAAEGLLARMYMFQSKFSLAKPYLEDIIVNGDYDMEKEYINCFTDSHDNGKERILEIQFCGGQQGQGQSFSGRGFPDTYRGDIPFVGAYSGCRVSDDMMKCYEEGDLRKEISTITNINVNGVIESNYSYVYKFSHYDLYQPKDKNDWANNYTLLRYTDVLMMYAECLNEEQYESDGEALSILNAVRKRAGLNSLNETDVPDQSTFRKAIQKERRVEFAFEGLRWFDLIRWGIAVETMNSYFMLKENGSGIYNMPEYKKIFPIPYDEIVRYNNDKIMWQNPQY